jgi:hypothetical protein
MDIKIKVPTPLEKGYLRRQRKALAFAEIQADKPSPEMVNAMVDFIVDFVVEPADKELARDAILDLSQKEFEEIMAAIRGEETTIPKANGEPSATGT